MKIWITGAKGQVGSVLLDLLRNMQIEHIGTTRQQVELGNEKQVMAHMTNFTGITHVIHTAGFTNVEAAEIQKDEAYLSNVIATCHLAKAASIHGAKLFYISTDYVFDGTKKTAYQENDPTNPLNWYGMTKRDDELCVQESGNYCIIRTSRIFGGLGREYVASLLRLMRHEKELHFASDQISRPTYVVDFAKALLFLVTNDASGIYHYANQGTINKYEFASLIWKAAKQKNIPMACAALLPILTSHWQGSAKRPLNTVLDTSKIEQLLSIPSWQDSFEPYLQSLLSTD
ncbi:MAG: dTDP-4-dehydrorhamnose reductase [Chlamydiales bacterium]|nr:dTDP-4-dehydrorhamnose reductase [Chlamydiales bacterium]